jgi:hypothetical protein
MVAIVVTRDIIENTDRKLTVHVTIEENGSGTGGSVVNDLIDFDDASDFKQDGQSLASDGFHSSTGVPMKSVKIQRILATTERATNASPVVAEIMWHRGSYSTSPSSTDNLMILNLSAAFNQSYSNQVDYTSMGGFGSPFPNDSTDHRLLVNSQFGMANAHDGVIITLECTKVY